MEIPCFEVLYNSNVMLNQASGTFQLDREFQLLPLLNLKKYFKNLIYFILKLTQLNEKMKEIEKKREKTYQQH